MTISPDRAPSTSSRFRYDGTTMRALRATISDERFTTYLELAQNDRRRALQLYTYNAALGGAFHGPLQALEVTLRNAVHDAIAEERGAFWFDDPQLDEPQRDAVTVTKERLDWEKGPQTPGRIVAALSLGFWVALFAKRYEEILWRPTLHQCFDPTPARQELHSQLNRLRRFRNRVAHHEPILQRRLQDDHDAILWMLSMLSPRMEAWVRHHSRVLEVLGQPPHRIHRF